MVKFRFFVVLLLSGCSFLTPGIETQMRIYRCADDSQILTRQHGEQLSLVIEGQKLVLEKQQTREGKLFSGQRTQLRLLDDLAELEQPARSNRTCQRDRASEVWQDAADRGVGIRAAGVAPGWFVELQGSELRYAGDYGRNQLVFSGAKVENNAQLVETTIMANNAQHRLKMLIQVGNCWEKSSRKMFGRRATLDLDGTTFYGCGLKF